MNDPRADTLQSDLRAAFERRAAEVPDGPVPALDATYVATLTTPDPARRRPATVLLAGAAAALLGAVALVPILQDDTTPVATEPRSSPSASEPPSSPPTTTIWNWLADGDELVVAGTAGAAPWALVADGRGAVELRAEPRDGQFEGGFAGHFGEPPAEDVPPFLSLGPCCRLGGHTLIAAAASPRVVKVAATAVHRAGDATTDQWVADALPDPRHPDGWRDAVIPVPADVSQVEISLTYEDGTVEPLDRLVDLTQIGG